MIDKIFEKIGDFMYPCVFHEMTGLYCPGCGATRSLRFLVRGNIWKSFIYNPIILYMLISTFIFFVFVVKYKISGKHLNKDKIVLPMLYIGIAVMILNWIVKDWFLIFRGIDLLK